MIIHPDPQVFGTLPNTGKSWTDLQVFTYTWTLLPIHLGLQDDETGSRCQEEAVKPLSIEEECKGKTEIP